MAEPTQTKDSTIHLQKILVPTDFSVPAEKALQYAIAFAQASMAEIILVHAIEPTAPGPDMPAQFCYTDELMDGARSQLRQIADSSGAKSGLTTGFEVRLGQPANEIVEMAKERDVDLIVMATHGYTGWKHFCIGSTAEHVVRTAPCPVMVVREKEHEFI